MAHSGHTSVREFVRKAVDDFARSFRCGKDEVKIIGASGRAVELATMRQALAWHHVPIDQGPGSFPVMGAVSIASSRRSAVAPSGSRPRMSERRPSSSSVVKPCTIDQARAIAAP